MKVKLYNVIDTRNNKFYSTVICSQRNARFFVPAPVEEESEVEENEQ